MIAFDVCNWTICGSPKHQYRLYLAKITSLFIRTKTDYLYGFFWDEMNNYYLSILFRKKTLRIIFIWLSLSNIHSSLSFREIGMSNFIIWLILLLVIIISIVPNLFFSCTLDKLPVINNICEIMIIHILSICRRFLSLVDAIFMLTHIIRSIKDY